MITYQDYLEVKKAVIKEEVTVNYVMEKLSIPLIIARCLVKDWITNDDVMEVLQFATEECERIIKHFEECLNEVMEQKGLLEFLEKNEWATSEDYFVHLVKEALEKVSQK
jgi:hypothetical protein